ncbi:MAG: hypothetical protein WB697_19475 [Stellaceae bacterium]
MRMNTVGVIAFIAVAFSALSATAFAAAKTPQTLADTSMVIAGQCPAGTYFEAAGYVAAGKWRDAHCATGNGHE